jgi:hypothetical protein
MGGVVKGEHLDGAAANGTNAPPGRLIMSAVGKGIPTVPMGAHLQLRHDELLVMRDV